MSDDAEFDERLRREAQGYRAAARPPADAMWSRIEGDVASAIRRERRSVRRWSWIAAGAGVAATLVIGIAIGRRTASEERRPASPAVAISAPTSVDPARDAQMRAATTSHLVQAEVFLTEVRADLRTGRQDPQRGERSRHLLARTRLIMANDAGRAPAVERLLEDLELVLAEIAALPPPGSGERSAIDARLLGERFRAGGVLPRIRTILPSAPVTGGI